MADNIESLLIAFQQALLGEIGPSLRAVVIEKQNDLVKFQCFFDGDVSDEDKESMSCVETEIIASLPASATVECNIIRLDYPAMIPKRDYWVYYRREPDLE